MKIVFTGPESTGKTHLSRVLMKEFKGKLVPEYAREYLENKTSYDKSDVIEIARGQIKRMGNSSSKSDLVFFDSDLIVIKIWMQWKGWKVPQFVDDFIRDFNANLVFLLNIDLEWQYDRLRENPDDREELMELYRKELNHYGIEYVLVEGDLNERMEVCRMHILQLIKED